MPNKYPRKEKDFKPHKMYCKDGSEHFAKTFAKHKSLAKRGCVHSKSEQKKIMKDKPMMDH